MSYLTANGRRLTVNIAQQFGFSPDGVAVMVEAVARGDGRMAQFDHPDFGGHGQWMHGGMTMVGKMFDSELRTRVERLCNEIARLLSSDGAPLVEKPAADARDWWPSELGQPQTAGGQNGMRYAYFVEPRRLAIETAGRLALYDTGDHRISGVAQQQSASESLTFTSQLGVFDVGQLPVVPGAVM